MLLGGELPADLPDSLVEPALHKAPDGRGLGRPVVHVGEAVALHSVLRVGGDVDRGSSTT